MGSRCSPRKARGGRWPRCWEGRTGRAGVTQQPAPWAGSRGKARPGGLDLRSYWSSDRPSSLHYCFKRDPGDASFSKGLCCCSFDLYNKLTETNLFSLLRAGVLPEGEMVCRRRYCAAHGAGGTCSGLLSGLSSRPPGSGKWRRGGCPELGQDLRPAPVLLLLGRFLNLQDGSILEIRHQCHS